MKDRKKADENWRKLNEQLVKAMKQDDFGELSRLYSEMASQCHQENKPSFHLQKFSQEMGLRKDLKERILKRVEIFSADGCEECKKHNGEKYTIEEALEKMSLPVKTCKRKIKKSAPDCWCGCSYSPVIE